ncbi:hypothetical protein LJB95_03470 [Paludibacteraceae bacterium OttesenSCG-928-F17]|nr:hypothetical protein [Paludibacteraceae bacterium OttesenSCG-928-F17]
MKKIKIEELNLPKKKGIGWIVLLGWIPIINIFLAIFLISTYPFFLVGLRRTPYFRISKNKTLGNASLWGIIYLGITFIYIILAVLFFDLLILHQFWMLLFTPIVTFLAAIYFITYNIRYKNNIQYVDSFINDVMIKAQSDSSYNSLVTFKEGNNKGTKTNAMLEDLKRNNIIKVEKSNKRKEKIISFTPEFQQILQNLQ